MTRVPGPGASAYAAMRERAERAEQLAAGQRDALAAVLEAIGIPHAATVGDGEICAGILLDRVMHARIMLAGILEPAAAGLAPLARRVAYLRERLAECPATGYKTWDEAVAEMRAGQDGAR